MFSRNSIYPVSCDGALSAHINDNHDHVFRYKSYYENDKLGCIGEKILLQHQAWPKPPRFSNCAKQDLPLPDSRIGAFKSPLSTAIMHGLLLY